MFYESVLLDLRKSVLHFQAKKDFKHVNEHYISIKYTNIVELDFYRGAYTCKTDTM